MNNSWNLVSIYPAAVVFILLLVICGLFSGCYTLKQGITLFGYLNRAIPLEQADDEEFVRLVTDIRSFAMNELGLAMSKNYTRYVEIDRNYLAAVVSASAKDSFRRHDWSFPIVGKMPYKGFFKTEDAHKERLKLEKKDLDVWVRGVGAFSTLGWFRDPLYSYMSDYSPFRLADMIIHELMHATVFIKGQVKFNEELAEFIGTEGKRLFMEKHYGINSDEYRKMLTDENDNKKFVEFIQELIVELDVLYSSDKTKDEKLTEKEIIITAAKERFNTEYDSRFSSNDYRYFYELPINNAYLELFRLYYAEDNFMSNLYEKSGKDLVAFINAAKMIKRKGDPREQLERLLF